MMSSGKDHKDLLELAEIVYLRKWVLIAPVILCTLAGLVISRSLPVRYRSTTLILVEQQQVPEQYVMPTDKTPFVERLNTIKQQILSRSRLEQIVEDFNLYKGTDGGGLLGSMSGRLGLGKTEAAGREDLIEMLRKDIEIKVMGDSKKGGDAFSINYTGKDPYVTMQVTNTLASFFIDENLKAREQYAEGTSEFLSNELDRAKQDLEVQERALRRFKESRMGSLPEQLEANLRTLDRLQMELQSLNIAMRAAEERKIVQEEAAGAAVNSPSAGGRQVSLEAELERLNNELAFLRSTYKESYPDIIIVKNRIQDIESRIEARESPSDKDGADAKKPARTYGGGEYKAQIAALSEREAGVRRQIKEYEKRVEDSPANEQRMSDLHRDYDISFKNYQTLLEKKLNARLAENMEKRQKGERFKVIDPANLPERPYKNDKMKVAFGGLAAGVGAGLGLIFMMEYLNPAFRKPEELEAVLPYQVLASIPVFQKKQTEKKRGYLKIVSGGK